MLTVFCQVRCLRPKVPFNTSEVIALHIGIAKGASGLCPPKIFSISSNFVLGEAVSQTKYC